MKAEQMKELVLQALTHEKGGVKIYETALECVVNRELKKEWTEYRDQTEEHVEALTAVCEELGLDAGETTPGCKIVEHTGKALVQAMKMALDSGDKAAAELVACDCVVLAETKDHANWGLLGKIAENLPAEKGAALRKAYRKIEEEEDEHLYHSKGWCRELALKALGLKAILPPPEETDDVKSAIAAEKSKAKADARR